MNLATIILILYGQSNYTKEFEQFYFKYLFKKGNFNKNFNMDKIEKYITYKSKWGAAVGALQLIQSALCNGEESPYCDLN